MTTEQEIEHANRVLKTGRRARWILEIAQRMSAAIDKKTKSYTVSNHIEEIQLHFEGYSEPGYDAPLEVVATGNWNTIDRYDEATKTRVDICDLPKRVCELFEKIGVEIEWSDEWSSCSNCYKLFRTQGDSYWWQPSFVVGDGDITCHECLEEDPEAHLLSLEDNERACNTIENIDPADHGYVKVNDEPYETGFHPGQHDDPAKVAKDLRGKGITRFVFQLDGTGQFDSRWSVYVHDDEAELLLAPEEDPGVEDEDDEPGDIEGSDESERG